VGTGTLRFALGAHWCPISALHERPQAVAVTLVAVHLLGVQPQRELGIGVPELPHHVARVLPQRDKQRRQHRTDGL
jgi:hypothetical protein